MVHVEPMGIGHMAGEAKGLVVTSQHQGDSFTITTFIPPRRNGGPNVGAYGAVMSLLATVVPDAYDPEPAPTESPVAPAVFVPIEPLPHDIAAAVKRDLMLRQDDDLGAPGEPPRCSTGGCGDE